MQGKDGWIKQTGRPYRRHRGTGASVVAAVPSVVCKTIEMTVEIQWRREPLQ